jgi:hypothetical protein
MSIIRRKPKPRQLYIPSNLDIADRHRESAKREDLGFATFNRDAICGPKEYATKKEGRDRG